MKRRSVNIDSCLESAQTSKRIASSSGSVARFHRIPKKNLKVAISSRVVLCQKENSETCAMQDGSLAKSNPNANKPADSHNPSPAPSHSGSSNPSEPASMDWKDEFVAKLRFGCGFVTFGNNSSSFPCAEQQIRSMLKTALDENEELRRLLVVESMRNVELNAEATALKSHSSLTSDAVDCFAALQGELQSLQMRFERTITNSETQLELAKSTSQKLQEDLKSVESDRDSLRQELQLLHESFAHCDAPPTDDLLEDVADMCLTVSKQQAEIQGLKEQLTLCHQHFFHQVSALNTQLAQAQAQLASQALITPR